MKRIVYMFSILALIATVFVACNRQQPAATAAIKYEDTVGLAQFQDWKAMNERMDMLAYQQMAYQQQQATTPAPVRKSTAKKSSAARSTSSGTMSSTSQNQAKVKKGWSKSAKYAVIGGAAGGVLGAVINKRNRVLGGVIGGVLGAGAGYGIGRSQDRKDGRIQ